MSGGPPRNDYHGDRGRHHRGPPPPYERGPPRGGGYGPPRDRPYPPHQRGRGGGGRSRHPPPRNNALITFRSFEEEREWVEERRRKREKRLSKFDVLPTPEQQLLQQQQKAAFQASSVSIHPTTPTNAQQTRHARRLYVGNLPPMVTEGHIQQRFTEAIQTALVNNSNNDPNPILNIYMNHERNFCFIEFKTVEMTTACMALDGLELQPGMPCKVKRPNDYNAVAAPKVHPSTLPELDVSRLGIISRTVVDGPNKIFIGGLHYHLQEPQVMELLSAFGKIKAFHLVKNDPADYNSKGYCFVEYADPAVTPIAAEGLNGMDIGGGKTLTARLAGGRGTGMPAAPPPPPVAAADPTLPPPNHTIIVGYDIDAMVDAAMGIGPMPPMTPQYMDPNGTPLTQIVSPMAAAAPTMKKSRILVLHNMATDEDLATDETKQELIEETKEECDKFGTLERVAVYGREIYLQYANEGQASAAEQELQGRTFGDSTIRCTFVTEEEFGRVEQGS